MASRSSALDLGARAQVDVEGAHQTAVRTSGPASVTAIESSKWAASEPSTRRDGPVVREDVGSMVAEREHRLDREAQAGLELAPAATGAVVGDLRFLVHLGADAVADELADDAEAVAAWRHPRRPPRCPRCGCLARPRRCRPCMAARGRLDQRLRTSGGGSPTIERPGRVAVPAVDDRAGVDRDDLTRRGSCARPGCRGRPRRRWRCTALPGNGRRGSTPG